MDITLELKPNKICVQPVTDNGSFTSEHKKYDRRSIAIIRDISDYLTGIEVGDKVIYDDSHSIDFNINGTELSIIGPDDIVATIKEGSK